MRNGEATKCCKPGSDVTVWLEPVGRTGVGRTIQMDSTITKSSG